MGRGGAVWGGGGLKGVGGFLGVGGGGGVAFLGLFVLSGAGTPLLLLREILNKSNPLGFRVWQGGERERTC